MQSLTQHLLDRALTLQQRLEALFTQQLEKVETTDPRAPISPERLRTLTGVSKLYRDQTLLCARLATQVNKETAAAQKQQEKEEKAAQKAAKAEQTQPAAQEETPALPAAHTLPLSAPVAPTEAERTNTMVDFSGFLHQRQHFPKRQ